MANVLVNENSLTAIGNAIREKAGSSDTYKPGEMAEAIINLPSGGGSDNFPEEGMVFTGDCSDIFKDGQWEWALIDYGSRMSTKDVKSASNMFNGIKKAKRIPFSINFRVSSGAAAQSLQSTFQNTSLTELPDVTGSVGACNDAVSNSMYIRAIPESWGDIDLSSTNTNTSQYTGTVRYFFKGCSSLRTIPEAFLKKLYNAASNASGYSGMFTTCMSLDEIVGLRGINNTMTANMFSATFDTCNRLKRIVFDKENNAPRVQKWAGQTIDLTIDVGYNFPKDMLDAYNTGITLDKEVYDAATYQALKNDADWFATDIAYSRYNHDSAVETINSLPDCSAYLAETSGNYNTIKFKSAAGSATDGGSIGNLTEAEIAVATAKGWTVSLV